MLKKILDILACGLPILCVGVAGATEPAARNPVVLMETSLGNVKLELFAKEAPISVKNFLDYVNSGFYDGTVYHRVIPNFMIQGGGFTAPCERPVHYGRGPDAPRKLQATDSHHQMSVRLSM